MKNFSILPICLLLFTISGFTFKPQSDTNLEALGIYGKNDLKLTLTSDQSFHYLNKMNPSIPIDITGTWEKKGDYIYLRNFHSNVKINSKWKLDKKYNCLKSRQSMTVVRICNCVGN